MGHLVGIDLGTTNSAIAFTELGRQRCVKVEKNELTSAIMPSCVAVNRRGEWLVGSKALRERGVVAREFKRHMGEDFAYPLGSTTMSPVELSALVLRRLREGFEEDQGLVDGAVITVPAMFNEVQRRETIEAGRLAGLSVLRVINEPSAAAIAYRLSDRPPSGLALVVDWGGGTLDVSLIDCDEDVLDVLANSGDMHLGGTDVDALVRETILKRLATAGHDLGQDPVALYELARIAEKIKIHLSEEEVWDEPLHLNTPPHFFEFELTRAEFESQLSPLMRRVGEVIRKTLEKVPGGSILPSQVEDVILVGGSCYLPSLQKLIRNTFGRPGRIEIDPMEVVAQGAAYQARYANSSVDAPVVTVHSLTQNLGIACIGEDTMGVLRQDMFSCLLPAGTKIPARHTETYYTTDDDQPAVWIRLFEIAEDVPRVEDLEPYEEREIRGLPARPAGSYPIHLTFDYNIDQTLTVTVSIPGHDVEETWVSRREEQLAGGRDRSRAKVDLAFGTSMDRLREFAERVRAILADWPTAVGSRRAFERFEAEISRGDLDAAILARGELVKAMGEEGLPAPGDR